MADETPEVEQTETNEVVETGESQEQAEPRSISLADGLNEAAKQDAAKAAQDLAEETETETPEPSAVEGKEQVEEPAKKPLTKEQLEANERQWRAEAFKNYFGIDVSTHPAHKAYDKPYEQLSPQEQAAIDADDEEYGKPGGRIAWLQKNFLPYVMLAIANERAMTEQRTKTLSSFETEKNEFISGKPELGDKFAALTSGPNALTPQQALSAMKVLYGQNQTQASPKGASKPKALPPVKGSNATAKDKAARGSREQATHRGETQESTGDEAIDQLLAQLGRR